MFFITTLETTSTNKKYDKAYTKSFEISKPIKFLR